LAKPDFAADCDLANLQLASRLKFAAYRSTHSIPLDGTPSCVWKPICPRVGRAAEKNGRGGEEDRREGYGKEEAREGGKGTRTAFQGGGTDNPEKAYNYNRHAVRCLLSGPSRNSAAAFESIC